MMVGSVRGKERLEIVLRVWQCGRSPVVVVPSDEEEPDSMSARSRGGQMRFELAFTETVGYPQPPQKVLRVFQSM